VAKQITLNIKRLALMSLSIMLLAMFAIACGGSDTSSSSSSAAAAPTAAPAAAAVTKTEATNSDERITVLIADLEEERVFPPLAGGPDVKYLRVFMDDMVSTMGGGDLVPGIVSKWEVSADGTTWIIDISDDKGIKWHNGDPLTVDDVMLSLEQERGQLAVDMAEAGCFNVTETAYVKYTKSLDLGPGDNQITYAQNRVALNFPFNFSQSGQDEKGMVLPAAYVRPMIAAAEAKGSNEMDCFTEFEENPIGTGPFSLESYDLGLKYSFDRNDDYWFTKANGFVEDRIPQIGGIDMEVILEGSTRLAALQSGEADLIEANMNLVPTIEADSEMNVFWQEENSMLWMIYIDCWEEDMWCFTKESRQALQYGTDTRAIQEALYGKGATHEGHGWATTNAMGYSSDLDGFPYDPAKAKELWAAAGLDDSVTFKIWTWESGSFPFLPQVAELMVTDWKKNVGIDVDIEIGDQAAIKQSWNNRNLPGDMLIRDNEARYDGTSITVGGYCNHDTRWRMNEPETADGAARCKVIQDLALNHVVTGQEQHDNFNAAYKFIRDEGMHWGPFYSNVPWGAGKRIANYEPWKLVPYFTAPWTITLK
jgi:peptide/nickel transport system substrate-binding protein